MNLEKLYRLEALHEELASRRRARGETYRERLARSKELKQEATWKTLPEVQALSLASLLAMDDDELVALGVNVTALRRAGFEKRSADGLLRNPEEERRFADLGTLVANLREYVRRNA